MPTPLPTRSEATHAARYEALLRVLHLLTAQRNPTALFRVLASELRHVVTCDGISLALYDAEVRKHYFYALEIGPQPGVVPLADLPLEETMTWWVYQHQQPLVIPDIDTETRFPQLMALLKTYGMQSICGLPLTTVHRRLGGLCLGSAYPNTYSEEEVCFLALVADHVALVIDDALNFEAAQREKDRLELLLDLTNSLVSNLELRDLLRAISASVRRVMRCDGVGVLLPDAAGRQLCVYALDYPDSKGFIQEETLVPLEGSLPGKAFQTGKPVVLDRPDPAQVSPEDYRLITGEGLQSSCLLPLISRNRSLGVLGLARQPEYAFRQEEVEFLAQVAGQVAIAVENALAYGQIAALKDQLAQEKLYLEDEIRSEMYFEDIVGTSAALHRVLHQVEDCGTNRCDCPHLRRDRHGQGTHCARHSQPQRAASACLREAELRGHSHGTARKRALRARERGVYRCRDPAHRPLRAGQPWHDLSG